MYPLKDSIVKLWIMYEGTEKVKKHDIRHFVIETTKNLMNCNEFSCQGRGSYPNICFVMLTISSIEIFLPIRGHLALDKPCVEVDRLD